MTEEERAACRPYLHQLSLLIAAIEPTDAEDKDWDILDPRWRDEVRRLHKVIKELTEKPWPGS